jgi:hypothetical protein
MIRCRTCSSCPPHTLSPRTTIQDSTSNWGPWGYLVTYSTPSGSCIRKSQTLIKEGGRHSTFVSLSHLPVKLIWRYAHITCYNGNVGVPRLAFIRNYWWMPGAMDGVSTFRQWAPINLFKQDQSHRPLDHITSPVLVDSLLSPHESLNSLELPVHTVTEHEAGLIGTHSCLSLCCFEVVILPYTLPIHATGVWSFLILYSNVICWVPVTQISSV